MDNRFKTREHLLIELDEAQVQIAELELIRQESQRMQQALTSLLRLSQTLVSTHQVEAVLEQAVTSAVEIATASDRGSIQLLDEDGKTLQTVATSGKEDPIFDQIKFLPGVGIAGHALVSGEVINVADVLTDKRFVVSNLPLRFRSLIVAPLVSKGQRLGTLSLSGESANAFPLSHEILIRFIADQVAVALENAQLFTELRSAQAALV
ncbi:MAG: GAF domain-containing protein [Chloroflexota bacterium]